jgi:transposase
MEGGLMTRFVGLDVHKRIVEICIIDEVGKVLFRGRCPVSREDLLHLATKILQPGDHVALEATTNTWAVVRILKPHVARVVVGNPLKTKAIAEANVKTDKVDAYVLAQLLRCDFLPLVWQPDEHTQELRRLTGHRSRLVADRTGIRNRIHSVLAQRLIVPEVKTLFSSGGIEWLKILPIDPEGRSMIDSELRLHVSIEKEIDEIDGTLAGKGFEDERVKLLMTLPGVDVAAAMTVIAALGDIKRFRDGDHAASYLGLVPSTRQSAEHCYNGPITKAGNVGARWMLVQAAHHLGAHPGPLGGFFRRLLKKKNRNVAVVGTARKLVVVAWHMLMKNEPYRYAQPRTTELKLSHLRVKVTGKRRKSGPAPGVQGKPQLEPGIQSRTIKPLSRIYAQEGLPPLGPVPAGEDKAIREACVSTYVESLTQTHVVPRIKPSGE